MFEEKSSRTINIIPWKPGKEENKTWKINKTNQRVSFKTINEFSQDRKQHIQFKSSIL